MTTQYYCPTCKKIVSHDELDMNTVPGPALLHTCKTAVIVFDFAATELFKKVEMLRQQQDLLTVEAMDRVKSELFTTALEIIKMRQTEYPTMLCNIALMAADFKGKARGTFSIFDMIHMQRGVYAKMFGALDDETIRQLAEQLKVDFEELKASLNTLQVGQSWGGMHPADVMHLTNRAFFEEGVTTLALKISRLPEDESGHLDVAITDIDRADPCAASYADYSELATHDTDEPDKE